MFGPSPTLNPKPNVIHGLDGHLLPISHRASHQRHRNSSNKCTSPPPFSLLPAQGKLLPLGSLAIADRALGATTVPSGPTMTTVGMPATLFALARLLRPAALAHGTASQGWCCPKYSSKEA